MMNAEQIRRPETPEEATFNFQHRAIRKELEMLIVISHSTLETMRDEMLEKQTRAIFHMLAEFGLWRKPENS